MRRFYDFFLSFSNISRQKKKIAYVQIFGERNSGTNWLNYLVEKNFPEVEVGKRFGWKHGFIKKEKLMKEDLDTVLFLVIFKEPYSWIVSMHNKPHHAPQLYRLPFSEFIRSEWACYKGEHYFQRNLIQHPLRPEEEMLQERDPITKLRFENIVLLRNAKVRSHLSLKEFCRNVYFINYESLLEDTDSILTSIAQKYNLNKASNLDTSTGYFGKNPGILFNKIDYYLKKEYFSQYTLEDFNYVNRYLDKTIEESIGYRIIHPDELRI